MLKKLAITSICTLLLLNTPLYAGVENTSKSEKFQDYVAIINGDCKTINPSALSYLRNSDYLQKRERTLNYAIEYSRENNERYRELKNDATSVSLASSWTGATSLGALIYLMDAQAFMLSTHLPQVELIIVAADVTQTAASLFYLLASPYNATKAAITSKTRTEEKGKEIAQTIGTDFKHGHERLDLLRNEVDLNYTRLQNGLSLGVKARNATEELYSISLAKTLLYELELKFVNETQEKVASCLE